LLRILFSRVRFEDGNKLEIDGSLRPLQVSKDFRRGETSADEEFTMVAAAIFLILPLCLALAAFTDLFTMTIPNRIPVILLGSFLVIAPFTGMEWSAIGLSLVAGFAVLSVCFTLFAFNVMGGGDAKLLTAAAVWFGFNQSLLFFLVTVGYLGGALTLVILLLRWQSNSVLAAALPIPNSLLMAKKVPYGIAIGAAGLLTFGEAPILQGAISSLY
jgi:prepilin peptidase CpaA